MTIADCARHAVAALVTAGNRPDDARRDVAVLARHLLGWDVATWITRQRDRAPASFATDLTALVTRRASGEPSAYLLGSREFYGREFRVTRDVLIPRPETELLVEQALDVIDGRPPAAGGVTVVDVGTGSGCVAVTLAAERSGVRGTATDTSAGALAVAVSNATRHAVADRLTFLHGSLTVGATEVDLVVSNPPYVAEADRDHLMRDVRDFEPASALFAGPDGLAVIKALAPDAFRALRAGGMLVLEIGAGQGDAVAAHLAAVGFTGVTARPDLAGIPRVIAGVRPTRSV